MGNNFFPRSPFSRGCGKKNPFALGLMLVDSIRVARNLKGESDHLSGPERCCSLTLFVIKSLFL